MVETTLYVNFSDSRTIFRDKQTKFKINFPAKHWRRAVIVKLLLPFRKI